MLTTNEIHEGLEALEISVYHSDVETMKVWCGDEYGGFYGSAHIGEVSTALEYLEDIEGDLAHRFEVFHNMVTFDPTDTYED